MVIKTFESKIAKLPDSRVYMYHLVIPEAISNFYKQHNFRRLLCMVNQLPVFSMAILHLQVGHGYINMSKDRLKQAGLKVGDSVSVQLSPDESKYGMPVPHELEEIFSQDTMAFSFFEKLSPGKQRTLLYMIGKYKTEEKRIEKGLVLSNYLKQCQGKFDFKELHTAFKKGL